MIEFNSDDKLSSKNEIEHVTETEISEDLQDEIDKDYNHIFNRSIHITEEDRIKWDTAKDRAVSLATRYKDGYMSKIDKAKLDSIEDGAINYKHPDGVLPPGSYMKVKINDTGHVVSADTSLTLDISATDVLRIDDTPVDEFFRYTDNIIETDSIITDEQYTANTYTDILKYKDNHLSDPVEAQFNKAPIPSAILTEYPKASYYVSDDTTPPRHQVIRISPTTNKMYYFDREKRTWVYFSGSGDLAKLNDSGKIDPKYFSIEKVKNSNDIPIGSIHYTIFDKKWAIDNGFLPLDGSTVLRKDYSDLWEYANRYSFVITDELWLKTKEYSSTSVPEFSSGDGDTTFRIPLIGDFLKATVDPNEVATVLYDTNVYMSGEFSNTPPEVAYNSQNYTRGVTVPDEQAYSGCFFLGYNKDRNSYCYGDSDFLKIGNGGVSIFDTSKILQDVVAEENYPRYRYGLFVIKAK